MYYGLCIMPVLRQVAKLAKGLAGLGWVSCISGGVSLTHVVASCPPSNSPSSKQGREGGLRFLDVSPACLPVFSLLGWFSLLEWSRAWWTESWPQFIPWVPAQPVVTQSMQWVFGLTLCWLLLLAARMTWKLVVNAFVLANVF